MDELWICGSDTYLVQSAALKMAFLTYEEVLTCHGERREDRCERVREEEGERMREEGWEPRRWPRHWFSPPARLPTCCMTLE